MDQASGKVTSVSLATGFDAPDTQHQVGGDGFDPATLPAQPQDPYLQIERPTHTFAGASSASGQTTGALAYSLRFDRRGIAAARILISAGRTPNEALAQLRLGRARSFSAQLRTVQRDWRAWLDRTLLPAGASPRINDVAKRTLITIRLAIDPDSGAIVASSDTQGPYGEDWIRDGAFINQVLDRNGYQSIVTRHNLFYAAIQTSATNPSALRPPGNWAMTSYGDGIDGGPIPFEIDETGLGIWGLAAHADYLPRAQRAPYLRRVFQAIARAADFLTLCADPFSGLQCAANEDDNPTPSQSLHGAETTELGLRSALAVAATLHDTGAEVSSWRARLVRLDAAIASLYDPRAHAYREGDSAANAYNLSYGDGGWLLWPVRFRPYDDPTMRGEADAVRRAMDASLAGRAGEYEAKALLALGYAWKRPTPSQSRELRRVLSYLASRLTTPTGLFGEAWERFAGSPVPVEDMPHVWEHSLFYLAALQIDGAHRYLFAETDFVKRACLRGAAPQSICRPG
jgi:GH15 family glucan-1,4-alpha-glucosidase